MPALARPAFSVLVVLLHAARCTLQAARHVKRRTPPSSWLLNGRHPAQGGAMPCKVLGRPAAHRRLPSDAQQDG